MLIFRFVGDLLTLLRLRGCRHFDAPVSLVLTFDKYLEPAAISQFALGTLAYGIVLAAWEPGLGCVING